MNLAKLVSLSIALLLIQACSHPIEIVGEGDVASFSGNRNCSLEQFTAADPVCSENYAIGAYQEIYYPVPRAGWKFDHWVNYCTTATGPYYDCPFNVSAAIVQQFWWQTVPPLKAVFTPIVPTPIHPSDIVSVDGKEWAQPDIFTNISWDEVNLVCPSTNNGVCIPGSVLNGFDLTGWTWAGSTQVAQLINYLGMWPEIVIPPVLPFYIIQSTGTSGQYAYNFFITYEFRTLQTNGQGGALLNGLTNDVFPNGLGSVAGIAYRWQFLTDAFYIVERNTISDPTGVFMHRPAS